MIQQYSQNIAQSISLFLLNIVFMNFASFLALN